tara:strand:+ start:506 stop:1186 length:681 start_codon:yes stop_codon:yes gene_type:complete
MKKAELKAWLNKDKVNRRFIRRIGIPQYTLVDITNTKELEDIKNEFIRICRSDNHFKQVEKEKGSDFSKLVLDRMFDSSFWQGYWYKRRHESRNLLSTWSYLLKNVLGDTARPWEARSKVSRFFSNVRLFFRNKKAKLIESNTDIVYTVKSNTWGELVESKFLTTWSYKRNTIKPGMPILFIEKDYANRYIFMVGSEYVCLSLPSLMKVKELQQTDIAVAPELRNK